jgi:nitroreductase
MVLKGIRERYSVRSFSDQQPSDEQILDILEAARLAPSWMNVQPWHFIVIKDNETKELLSKLAHGQPHVAKAPVIIACCGNTSAWNPENFRKILEQRGMPKDRINTVVSNPLYNAKVKGRDALICRTVEELTYAAAYMTLEAKEVGLDTCTIGAIGNDLTGSIPEIYQQVKQKLNLPDHIILVSLLLVGYASSGIQNPSKSRKTPDEIFSFEKFGNKNA